MTIQNWAKVQKKYIGAHRNTVQSADVGTVGYLSFGSIEKIIYVFCDLSACIIEHTEA